MSDKQKLKVSMVQVASLQPYEFNSRTHPPEQIDALVASIQRFGFNAPVLVQPDGTVVAGHGRLEAAIRLGMKTVPAIVLNHLSADEARAYLIADNKIGELAGWDRGLLAQELQNLEALGDELQVLQVLGFDEDELANLLGKDEVEGDASGSGPGANDGGGTGSPVISYNIVFENEAQQERFYRFLKMLRTTQPGDTIAERLNNYLSGLELPE